MRNFIIRKSQLNKRIKNLKFPSDNFVLLNFSLIIAALSNIILWRYHLIFDQNFYRAAIIPLFLNITENVGVFIMFGSICSLFLLRFKKYRFIPYLCVSFSQFICLFTSYYSHRNTVIFSTIVFFLIGIALLRNDKTLAFLPISILVSLVYFFTGISKLNEPSFYDGQIIMHIFSSSILPLPHSFSLADNTWPIRGFLKLISITASYLTVFIELIFLPISIFLNKGPYKLIRLYLACPFHFLLFFSGNGGLFHLIFPALLLCQVESLSSEINFPNNNYEKRLTSIIKRITIFFSYYYLAYLCVVFMKRIIF